MQPCHGMPKPPPAAGGGFGAQERERGRDQPGQGRWTPRKDPGTAPDYFRAPAVSPCTTWRWKMMYAARTGSIAITRPAKSPDQSPL